MNILNINSNPNPSKRRVASEDGCKKDLSNELPILFDAFTMAFKNYELEIVQTPPNSRARGFEASLLNSKMIQSIQETFPKYWKYGRYKRFTLNVNGYIILFKKLNNKNMPMNIQTKSVSDISNQLALSLFDENTYVAEPILFFGYKKNKFGQISDPKLVYIDENNLKWAITEHELNTGTVIMNIPADETIKVAMPKLKVAHNIKKASNNE